MNYFRHLTKYRYWLDPIRTIRNLQSLSYPQKPDFYVFSKEKFIQSIPLRNNCTLLSLKDQFNVFCSAMPLNYFLQESSIPLFIDCLFDDFVIELLDICLFQMVKKSITSRTVREKLAYSKSSANLDSHIHDLYTKAQPTEYWSFFLASNIITNKANSYSLKLTSSPAIIASIEMEEQIGVTPGNIYNNLTLFQNSFSMLKNVIEGKENDWKAYLGQTISNPIELTSYHLEKIWKFNYFDSLINAFSKPQIGLILPNKYSDFKHRPQYVFHPVSPLEKVDIKIYSDVLDLLNLNTSYIQTNLFLIQYLFNYKIVADLFDSQPLTFFISDVIPLLKEALFYGVYKHCITEEISGSDLYSSVYEYCKSYSFDTLKRCYSITNFQCKTKLLEATDKDNVKNYLNWCDFKNPQDKLRPAMLYADIQSCNSIFNECIYSPSMFEDINSFNRLNANNSRLHKLLN